MEGEFIPVAISSDCELESCLHKRCIIHNFYQIRFANFCATL